MPRPPAYSIRFPHETVDQITDICDQLEQQTGFRPDRSAVVIRAIAELHRTVVQEPKLARAVRAKH